MIIALLLAFAVFGAQAQTAPNTAAATASTTAPIHTASVTGCHSHEADVFCIDGSGEEVQMSMSVTPTGGIPAQFTGCHSHGSEQHCKDPEGNGAFYMPESTTTDEHSHEESSGESGVNCHFHAGVEHCVGPGESEESSQSGTQCNVQDREYDVPLRIGTLFVVLVTSAIGVFAPMLLVKLPFRTINTMISTGIKQFGTGIIIATAFVHLYTHANLMFTNDCLGELEYEATTSAIVMAGIFLSFLVEYIGHRIILARGSKTPTTTLESPNPNPDAKDQQQPAPETTGLANLSHSHGPESINPNTKFSVLVMEAGIVFHSILIGITLVVAGDSFYRTLLVVIVFHQFFEGLALGVRIALLPGSIFPSKVIMAAAFSVITPVGMAIGIGVLHSFNGNDKSTLIALGTLDALSAGILVWVGVVDMWARDWVVTGGEMVDAGVGKVSVGGVALIAGLVLMSLLGKWA